MSNRVYLLDDFPLHSRSAHGGLGKVNARIVEDNFGINDLVVCTNFHATDKKNRKFFARHYTMPRVIYLWFRLSFKVPYYVLLGLFIVLNAIRSCERQKLFVPIGTDQSGVRRLRGYAMLPFVKSIHVYLVDDPFLVSGESPSGNFYKDLSTATFISVISQGLQQHLTTWAVKSRVMALKLPRRTMIERNVSDERYKGHVLVLGNYKNFYYKGIIELLELIRKLQLPIKVIFTRPLTAEISQNYGEFVIVKTFDQHQLARAMAAVDFCYLGFSSDSKHEQALLTSFPSKLFEYIQYARNIVVYSPKKSNAGEYCIKNSIGEVFESTASMERMLTRAYYGNRTN